MRKHLVLPLLALGAILPCSAADIGIGLALSGSSSAPTGIAGTSILVSGVSPSSSGAKIYVPVTFGPSFMLEGLLTYQHQYSEYNQYQYTQTPTGGTYTATAQVPSSSTTQSVSVGIFWVHPTTETSRLYLGPRIGFGQSRQTAAYPVSTSATDIPRGSTNTLFIAPVLGFEYFPVKSVSLGGEVGVSYARSHSSRQGEYPLIYVPDHSEQEGTFSSIILRYYF